MGTRLSHLDPDSQKRVRDFYAWAKARAAEVNAAGWQSDLGDALSNLACDLADRFPELSKEDQ